MLGLFDKYTARTDLRLELLKACEIHLGVSAYASLEKKVRGRFLLGVHNAFQEAILAALTKECDTQQEMADALGLDDRSNIPHIKKSRKLDGIRFTTALYRFPHLIKFPSRELAALYGFARATSFIKGFARDDASIEGTLTHQGFSYLVGVLAEPGWEAAVRNPEPLQARKLAAQIILDKTISDADSNARGAERPEQHVRMLQDLRNRWGYFAVLSLLIIPDDIPVDVTRGEVTA